MYERCISNSVQTLLALKLRGFNRLMVKVLSCISVVIFLGRTLNIKYKTIVGSKIAVQKSPLGCHLNYRTLNFRGILLFDLEAL